ncbi:MAG: PEP-CTERM sorting domain-containing protein [Planctomycetota bacterium]
MKLATFAASVSLASVPAYGQFTEFFDEALFLAELDSVTVETFDGFLPGDGVDAVTFFDFGAFTADGFNGAEFIVAAGGSFGDVNGTNFIDGFVGATPSVRTVVLTFDDPISALGADFVSPGSGSGLAFEVGGVTALDTTPLGFGSGFAGFTSDTPFTEVTLTFGTGTSAAEVFSFDDLAFGTLIPEPTSLALFGMAGPVGLRRRR